MKLFKRIVAGVLILTLNAFSSSSVLAQEITPEPTIEPTPTEIIVEPTVVPTESPVTLTVTPTPVPDWQVVDESTVKTTQTVAEGKTYTYKDTVVSVKFTKITQPGFLTIKEIKLTAEEQQKYRTLSDKAYDITSDMPDGSFTYDLTLPNPKPTQKAVVKFSEDGKEYTEVTNEIVNNTLVIKDLNHFTIFIITDDSASYTTPGNWIDYASEGYQDTGVHYSTSVSESATWTFSTITAGNYGVYVSWSTDTDRTTTAQYTLGASVTTLDQTLLADQSTTGGTGEWSGWYYLGPFSLTTSSNIVLTDSSGSGNKLIADEVLIVSDVPPLTVYVDDNYTANGPNDGHVWGYDAFATIEDGLSAVAVNGTVNVKDGNYSATQTMSTNGVTLDGESNTGTVLNTGATNIAITVAANNVTIKDMKITGNGDGINAFSVSSLTVQDNVIDNNTFALSGVYLEDVTTATVTGNNLTNNTVAMDFAGIVSGLTITGNTFAASNTKDVINNSNLNIDLTSNTWSSSDVNTLESRIDHNCTTSPYVTGTCDGNDTYTNSVKYVSISTPSVASFNSGALVCGAYTNNNTIGADLGSVPGANITYELDKNGATSNLTSTTETPVVISPEGPWTYKVKAFINVPGGDVSGVSSDCNLTLDTTSPVVTFNNDVEVGPVATDTINASVVDTNADTASYSFAIDDGDNLCNASDTYANPFTSGSDFILTGELANGKYVCLKTADLANNIVFTKSANVLNIDATNPSIGTVTLTAGDFDPYARGNGAGFSISATVSDTNGVTSCEYTLDGSTWLAGVLGGGTCTKTGLTATNATALTINVRATDSVGNIGTGVAISRTADSANPTVSGIAISPDTGTYTSGTPTITANLSDTVSPLILCQYRYRVSPAGAFTAFATGTLTTTGPTTATCTANIAGGLTDATAYDFQIRARDSVNHNSATSTITRTVDNSIPSVNAGTDNIVNVAYTQDATVNAGVAGVATYAWTKISGPGTLTFGTPAIEDTTVSADTDGSYVVRLTVTDNVGNSAFDEMNLLWDTVAPDTILTAYTPDPTNDNTPSYSGTATDTNTITLVEYRVDSGSWIAATGTTAFSFTTAILSDATHTIETRATDQAGNVETSYASDTLTVDTTAPTAIVTLGTPLIKDADLVQEITITYNEVMDPGFNPTIGISTTTGTWTSGAGSWTSSTVWDQTFTLTDANETRTGVTVDTSAAKDIAGNTQVASPTVTFNIDTQNPTLTAVTIASDNTNPIYAKAGDVITINFTSSESINTPSATILGNTATITSLGSNNWKATWTTTSTDTEGVVTFTIDYADLAGNSGAQVTTTTDTSSVLFDRTKPTNETAVDTGTWTNNAQLVFTWPAVTETGSGVDYYKFYLNTAASHTTPVPFINGTNIGNILTYTLTSGEAALLSSGTQYFGKIRAIDKAGNVQTSGGNWSDGITLDQSLPTSTITSPVTGYYKASTWPGSISGTASDTISGLNKVEVSTDTITWNLATGTSAWSYTLTPSIDGVYSYYSKATDNATNVQSPVASVTNVVYDITNPTGSWNTPADGITISGSTTLDVTANDNLSGVASVKFQHKVSTATTFTDIASSTWDTTPLALGQYTIRAVITDKSGNVTNVDRTVYVAAVITSISNITIDQSRIQINWTTDRPTDARVIFDKVTHSVIDPAAAPNYGYAFSTGTADTTFTTSHQMIISGLSDTTSYFFRAVSAGTPVVVSEERQNRTMSYSGAGGGGGGGGGTSAPAATVTTNVVAVAPAPAAVVGQVAGAETEEEIVEEEITPTPEPTIEPTIAPQVKGVKTTNFNWFLVIIPAALFGLLGGSYFLLKREE